MVPNIWWGCKILGGWDPTHSGPKTPTPHVDFACTLPALWRHGCVGRCVADVAEGKAGGTKDDASAGVRLKGGEWRRWRCYFNDYRWLRGSNISIDATWEEMIHCKPMEVVIFLSLLCKLKGFWYTLDVLCNPCSQQKILQPTDSEKLLRL